MFSIFIKQTTHGQQMTIGIEIIKLTEILGELACPCNQFTDSGIFSKEAFYEMVEPKKKILLLGATGRTGAEVMVQALNKGHQINILIRNAQKVIFAHPNLRIFVGDTRNLKDLNEAISGCDAVISCLNISRKNDFPWAPLRTPIDFLSLTMRNLIQACQEKKIERLVFTSAWGVGESRPYIPGWFAWFIDNSNLSAAYLEHERQEALVRNSRLNWTIVRPVVLTNSKTPKNIKVILENDQNPSFTISRRDTARFLLNILNENFYNQKIPTICSCK